jgi:hypothetical protein
MHCHIAWHASSGLSIQFVESANQLDVSLGESGILPGLGERCELWANYYEENNVKYNAEQDDSGI